MDQFLSKKLKDPDQFAVVMPTKYKIDLVETPFGKIEIIASDLTKDTEAFLINKYEMAKIFNMSTSTPKIDIQHPVLQHFPISVRYKMVEIINNYTANKSISFNQIVVDTSYGPSVSNCTRFLYSYAGEQVMEVIRNPVLYSVRYYVNKVFFQEDFKIENL